MEQAEDKLSVTDLKGQIVLISGSLALSYIMQPISFAREYLGPSIYSRYLVGQYRATGSSKGPYLSRASFASDLAHPVRSRLRCASKCWKSPSFIKNLFFVSQEKSVHLCNC